MSAAIARRDLAVLVADKNIEAAVQGLLSRTESLGIRAVTCGLYVHPERDPGCRLRGHDFLKPFAHRYQHALVVFDREGSGGEEAARSRLEEEVEERLATSGWGNRAAVIAIDPELEIWVWNDSSHVARVLGWDERPTPLRAWAAENGWWPEGASKPSHPKRAVEEALRIARKPRSSSMYRELAQKVSTQRCVDPAFMKLRQVLSRWFPG